MRVSKLIDWCTRWKSIFNQMLNVLHWKIICLLAGLNNFSPVYNAGWKISFLQTDRTLNAENFSASNTLSSNPNMQVDSIRQYPHPRHKMLGVVHPNPRMGTLQERCGPIDIIRLMMVEWLLEIIMSRRSKFALDHEPAFGKETVPVTPDIGVGVPCPLWLWDMLEGKRREYWVPVSLKKSYIGII